MQTQGNGKAHKYDQGQESLKVQSMCSGCGRSM